jgi:hypothetical protein
VTVANEWTSVAEQRYTWHGRFDEQDHPGHEEQAEEWANRATVFSIHISCFVDIELHANSDAQGRARPN